MKVKYRTSTTILDRVPRKLALPPKATIKLNRMQEAICFQAMKNRQHRTMILEKRNTK